MTLERGGVMFQVNGMSQTPVYEQIVEQVERFVAKGLLQSGSRVPSVRSLSMTLLINPNTIQKAYSDLTGRGILTSVPGKGIFISDGALERVKEKGRRKVADLKDLVTELRIFGVEKQEIIEIVDAEYADEGGKRSD